MAKTLEKLTKNLEIEQEEHDRKILESAREFFIDAMPARKETEFKDFSLSDLFALYVSMMEKKPTVEGFAGFLVEQFKKQDKESGEKEQEELNYERISGDPYLTKEFKKFLFEKLPRDLPLFKRKAEQLGEKTGYEVESDDLIEEFTIEELMDVHKKRKDRLILGFHVSGKDITSDIIEQSRLPSTIYIDGELIEVPVGYVHYNINPRMLYKGFGGGPKFLYLIEGSTADSESRVARKHLQASGPKWWMISPSPLKIRAKIELTPRVIEELGVAFE